MSSASTTEHKKGAAPYRVRACVARHGYVTYRGRMITEEDDVLPRMREIDQEVDQLSGGKRGAPVGPKINGGKVSTGRRVRI